MMEDIKLEDEWNQKNFWNFYEYLWISLSKYMHKNKVTTEIDYIQIYS